jgi:hypothetical protein
MRPWVTAAAAAIPEHELASVRALRGHAHRALELALSEAGEFEQALLRVLRAAVLVCARQRGLAPERLGEARLFEGAAGLDAGAALDELLSELEWRVLPVEAIGTIYETLNAAAPDTKRKQSGSFFTPRPLTRVVVALALAAVRGGEPGVVRVCDPALGAGAFLLEACRQLAGSETKSALLAVARDGLYGVDRSALAVAVAEASLWLLVGDAALAPRELGRNLRAGDSLLGDQFEWAREFPEVFGQGGGFDVVVGNPPWVAFAGRAAQPLAPTLRRFYLESYQAFRGYPTLHGLFVERAAQLAPAGVIALVVPSPIADLDGYRAVRRVATRGHAPREPLLEFGQDAFEAVTQPCFALVLDPAPAASESDRPWKLVERQRSQCEAEALEELPVLELLRQAPRLPPELFGEMGFQTSRAATETLLLRSAAPDAVHDYPLLEGRDVAEFRQGEPRLYLCADPSRLREARCRVRPRGDYQRVRFVVRQTAAVTIAALHRGLPFRNTLLAGFDHEDYSPELLVGLLNSALYRALHLTAVRDARQAVFPQVKIGHLRALPRPPADRAGRERVSVLALAATREGVSPALRAELDRAVFELFAVPEDHRARVLALLAARAPKLGHAQDGSAKTAAQSSLDGVRARLG